MCIRIWTQGRRPGQARVVAAPLLLSPPRDTQTADRAITTVCINLGKFSFLKSDVNFHFWFWIPWILLLFSADGRRPTWAVRGFRRTHFVCHYMRKGVFFFFQMFMGTAVRARARAMCYCYSIVLSLAWSVPLVGSFVDVAISE